MSKAIIDDVAARAGVSIKTVSRVVNREQNVRPQTREKVEAAIAELNYRPRHSARSLAANRSFMLGLIYGKPGAHYVLDIQEGVLEICRPHGYELVIHPGEFRDGDLVNEISELILDRRIDGVLLSPPISDHMEAIGLLNEAGIPLVRIAPTIDKDAYPFVETNDLEASFELASVLIGLGHRRIGFITGHPDHRAVGQRFEGYRKALKAHDITFLGELVALGDNLFHAGEEGARQLLSLGNPPTAIFAANDEMAGGVIKASLAMGLRIPQQLSVVGFDDAPISRQVWPSLSTIQQPIRDMAKTATSILLDQLRPGPSDPHPSMHPARLILRESIAKPAKPAA
ncbi:MAG: LacI family DNA-binding transcriptional regulator [Xanthomonadales bacterium]|nr:LacI family DNA-binding transcriptional regulator [Xanthomonadales bacterium]